MMRFRRVVVGLLLMRFLRRLPCGCILSWVFRLALWSGIAAGIGALIRRYLSQRGRTVTEYEVSGWTPPFADQSGESLSQQEDSVSYSWASTDTSSGPTMPEETLQTESEVEVEPESEEEVEAFAERIAEQIAESMVDDETDEEVIDEVTEDFEVLEEVVEAQDQEDGPQPSDDGPEIPPPLTERTWVKGEGEECPPEFPIKAKASSQIYYVPGSTHYSVTIPDVCFATEEAAEMGGYRPPKR
jgi:hypothetical protein